MKAVLLMSLFCLSLFSWSQDTALQSGNNAVNSIKETKDVATADPKKKDSLITYLEKLDLEKFEKKKTDIFLKALPANHKIAIERSDKKGYLYRTLVSIPDRPYLEIYIYYRGFEFTNPNSFLKRKQHRQVRMERISEINIFNEFMCMNGCD